MVTYVLDSSAVLRYLHNQAGAERVAEIINWNIAGECEAITPAAHWGEIAGITCKLYGRREMDAVLSRLASLGLQVVTADGAAAMRAALIKLKLGVPYTDSFAVELARRESNRVLVTADFDFKAASREVKIEFLPKK
jgi:predicted nucleic acid-binding protein